MKYEKLYNNLILTTLDTPCTYQPDSYNYDDIKKATIDKPASEGTLSQQTVKPGLSASKLQPDRALSYSEPGKGQW